MKQFDAAGLFAFWNASETDRTKLEYMLRQIGLEGYKPRVRSDQSALHNALHVYGRLHCKTGRQRVLVRPNENPAKNGYSLVIEDPEQDKVDLNISFTAKVEKGVVSAADVWNAANLATLQAMFDNEKRTVDGEALGESLARLCFSLGGISLRRNGGLWWLPRAALETWEKMRHACETCAVKKNTTAIEYAEVIPSDAALRMIRNAITEEILADANRIASEITSNTLGETALENRKNEAFKLHERIKFIEGETSQDLSRLHSVVAMVEQAAVQAALQIL